MSSMKDKLKKKVQADRDSRSQLQETITANVPVASIQINTQYRKDFNEDEIDELAASIRQHGQLQPLILTAKQDGTYMLVSGERRVRALMKLGYKEARAEVTNYTDSQRKWVQLHENVVRQQLNNYEKAAAYVDLMITDLFGGEVDKGSLYSKLLGIRNKKDTTPSGLLGKLDTFGVGIESLMQYAVYCSFPDEINRLLEKNSAISFKLAYAVFNDKELDTDTIIELFKKVNSGEISSTKAINLLKTTKKEQPAPSKKKKQIRLTSKVNSTKKALQLVKDSLLDDEAEIVVKDKKQTLDGLTSIIEDANKLIEYLTD